MTMEHRSAIASDKKGANKRFLGIWYRCCNVYGRLYRNRTGTAYTGRCPGCGAPVRACIGPGCTKRRSFIAE